MLDLPPTVNVVPTLALCLEPSRLALVMKLMDKGTVWDAVQHISSGAGAGAGGLPEEFAGKPWGRGRSECTSLTSAPLGWPRCTPSSRPLSTATSRRQTTCSTRPSMSSWRTSDSPRHSQKTPSQNTPVLRRFRFRGCCSFSCCIGVLLQNRAEHKTVGTLAWTAPEYLQHPGLKPHPRLDVYSFGVLMSDLMSSFCFLAPCVCYVSLSCS